MVRLRRARPTLNEEQVSLSRLPIETVSMIFVRL
jgi:hypothetical protein